MSKNVNLLFQIVIGIIIMIAPILITGTMYDVTKTMGDLFYYKNTFPHYWTFSY
ncbi:hypothetical protein [Bacillus tropicus]|uniref:hypothetical protein n=1 Tax=Bacillus tropicus TaxID=2026188 RepID=UPI000A978561